MRACLIMIKWSKNAKVVIKEWNVEGEFITSGAVTDQTHRQVNCRSE